MSAYDAPLKVTEQAKAEARAQVRLRKARAGDVGFITSSWLKSLRDSTTYWGVENRDYYTHHHNVLARLLARCAVFVAVLDDDPDHIVGFICYEVYQGAIVIHYVYIKFGFRKLGIADMVVRRILEEEERVGKCDVLYTAKTEKSTHIVKDKEAKGQPLGWRYVPWLAWVS